MELSSDGIDFLVTDLSGMTGLHFAAMNGHTDIVRYLTEQGNRY